MKVILSRKGFDSTYGGQPSPILPDGTLLSLPIPSKNDNCRFSDLIYQDKSYYEIIKEIKPNTKIKNSYTCHLDPDLRHDVIGRESNWKGLFGQMGSAQGHLKNENIQEGDLFLFFGWFKEAEITNQGLRYIKNAPDVHIIFAYMQIGRIYSSYKELPLYAKYHPHSNKFSIKNNCIYEASENLSINNSMTGAGCLNYNKRLVLTKEGETKSRWDLPDFFKEVRISYHSDKSFKKHYFDSAKKGQEFVIESNKKIIDWIKNIIKQ
ncbi:MAG: hypothetical protein KAT05_12235 [Spirochaetes bacterium]|nr:hypothetical protein [Spirochaetota bacterium]